MNVVKTILEARPVKNRALPHQRANPLFIDLGYCQKPDATPARPQQRPPRAQTSSFAFFFRPPGLSLPAHKIANDCK
jgi:hypothetical protein